MSDDTEITLGTGRVLLVFFALVVICALCFGLGFRLGRSTTVTDIAADVSQTQSAANATAKNTAAKQATTPPSDASTPPEQLTFYKSVEQKEDNPQLSTAANTSAAPASPTTADSGPSTPPVTPTQKAPEALPLSGYIVQVAAVTKPEDAEALVNALKKKQYAVFTSTNPPYDKLYHVQVGPFADVKEAEAVRSKLISDGYNPILKR